MKRILSLFLTVMFLVSVVTIDSQAKTPEIMSALKSHISTYGKIVKKSTATGGRYTATISYQKKKKRFLYQCKYTNGRSYTTVKMYMPIAKKKSAYNVHFSETVRGTGATAKISGKAKLKRKTYSEVRTKLSFSRKNKNKVAKRITKSAYQNAANSSTRVAFSLWEEALEQNTTLSLRNFGFSRITVFDPSISAKEWK